jgi:hypothetical protein
VSQGIYTGQLPASAAEMARQGYVLEDPDKYRGKPFRRWVKRGVKRGAGADIYEIVEVPTDIKHQRHIASIWKRGYPELFAWFKNPDEWRPYQWEFIVFRKADWKEDR